MRASEHEVSFRKAFGRRAVKIAFGTDMGGIPWTATHCAGVSAYGRVWHDTHASDPERDGSRAAELLEMNGPAGRDCAGGHTRMSWP